MVFEVFSKLERFEHGFVKDSEDPMVRGKTEVMRRGSQRGGRRLRMSGSRGSPIDSRGEAKEPTNTPSGREMRSGRRSGRSGECQSWRVHGGVAEIVRSQYRRVEGTGRHRSA